MRKALITMLCLAVCVALVASVATAREVENTKQFRPMKEVDRAKSNMLNHSGGLNSAAVQGTTYLGTWTFDSGPNCVDQGWTQVDLTVQTGEYWHVDDFAGLSNGDFGGLFALEGLQSMWCGARPAGTQELCGYVALPGYGNSWDQILCAPCLDVTGDVNLSFLASWDTEPAFDFLDVEWDRCDDMWTSAWSSDGVVLDSLSSVSIPDSLHASSTVRLRFHFTADGAWSDQDGNYNTDGAAIIDSIRIWDDTGTLSFEDFEGATVGDNNAGDWSHCNSPGYGDFSQLYNGLQVLQEDPCFSELSCVWGFFAGSTADYSCGGHPGVAAVPYENLRGEYITNEIWSPLLPWVGSGTTAELTFNVYRDLTLDALVFYIWHVRSFVAGCPGNWFDDNTVYFGEDKDWLPALYSIGDKIEPGATDIQVAVGAWDMCGFWCGSVGTGSCHSQSPLIDNIQVYRVNTQGPQWDIQGWRLFQDNFATDGTTTGTVRIDQANDLLATSNLNFLPGDSLGCTVDDPVDGLATDPYTGTGPAVYGYINIRPQNQPGKTGTAITDDASRWPVVDSVTNAGQKWYIVRMDTSFSANGSVVNNVYCLDLNDNLFTPGDTINYFLAAQSDDIAGSQSYFHGGFNYLDNFDASGAIITTTDIDVAFANAMEVTCLPTVQFSGGDILYVDDGDGRAVQPFFDSAFDQLGILDKVDRYDVRAPSSNVSNGPGARVQDVFQQVIGVYKKIIWNSEELEDGTIGDGAGGAGEKSDDFTLLYTFIDQAENSPGLYISGDAIATEWASLSAASALNLKNVYMNFGMVNSDHQAVGHGIAPLVIGTNGGIFDHLTGPDTLVAFGGCPGINTFDVMNTGGGASVIEATYNGNPAHGAILSQTTPNNGGSNAHVVLSGFTYELIRDDRPGDNGGVLDRVEHLYDILVFLENTPATPTPVTPTRAYNSLTQNYPNPFNPTTTIEFTVKELAPVSIRVYNVAGQLVRTLVNDSRVPGEVHQVTWDGRNDAGQSVSSGVYFYKLVTKNFTQTKKMVLLK